MKGYFHQQKLNIILEYSVELLSAGAKRRRILFLSKWRGFQASQERDISIKTFSTSRGVSPLRNSTAILDPWLTNFLAPGSSSEAQFLAKPSGSLLRTLKLPQGALVTGKVGASRVVNFGLSLGPKRSLQTREVFLGPKPIQTLASLISKSGCTLQELRITGRTTVPKASYRVAFSAIPTLTFHGDEAVSETGLDNSYGSDAESSFESG
ncbi:hypothetical protein C8R43DRAFT_965112 [Mycena crocata]|nr:hypothetical protein C8R43DRAFT_965112 [Mycena crocata]